MTLIALTVVHGGAATTFAQTRTYPRRQPDTSIGIILFLAVIALALIGLVIFCIIVVVIGLNRKSGRAAQPKVIAQQLGFSFTEKPAVPDFLRNTMFAQHSPLAIGGGMNNLLQGIVNDRPVLIFDFGITRTVGGSMSSTTRQTVACIPRGSNPPFILYAKNRMIAPGNIQAFVGEAFAGLAAG
jgi:hypothetical protein